MTSVTETVANLLTHPFGFHGDTGIRDFLYARLHVNGGERLALTTSGRGSPRSCYRRSTTRQPSTSAPANLLEARGSTLLSLDRRSTAPSKTAVPRTWTRCSPSSSARTRRSAKSSTRTMVDHSVETLTATSDVSKLYRELALHGLRQGWAIEFYDSRGGTAQRLFPRPSRSARGSSCARAESWSSSSSGFSPRCQHLVSSNDHRCKAHSSDDWRRSASRPDQSRRCVPPSPRCGSPSPRLPSRRPPSSRRSAAHTAGRQRCWPATLSRASSETARRSPGASSQKAGWRSSDESRATST